MAGTQLRLFVLPDLDPIPEAEGAGLPGGLAQLVEAGLALDVVLALHAHYRGGVLHVPKEVSERHHLAVVLGLEAALELCRLCGGGPINVPKGRWSRAVRDRLIRRDLDAGMAMREICRRYDVTERTVWSVGGRG